ncbi:MAG TPA: glycosyltransferase family 2 protein [Rubellimicrobium sp.]|nr:glycosyltransferase family 2 protein [Rubellimicrobium sp.]
MNTPVHPAVDAGAASVLIVVPTLNEAAHVGSLIDGLSGQLPSLNARVVVVDGGSIDGTCEIVQSRLSDRVSLLHNPRRLQSAAVNLAVAEFAGDDTRWLIRLDAHARYPDDYCGILLEEARAQDADSVVVSMVAAGKGFWQSAIALAQNSRFGNGGSSHRLAGSGHWVDHGHHALMRMDAFRSVGGYDPEFSHNEDAELDLRLRKAGYRIWLTGRTGLVYIPRSRPTALAIQYLRFGRGRARTLLKHRARPRARQAVVIALAPALALGLLAPWAPSLLALPLLWLLACLAAGLAIAAPGRDWRGLPAGLLAGLMQASWSLGFWRELLGRAAGRVAP